MRKHWAWSAFAVLTLLAAPLVSGCGSDDDDGGTGPTRNTNVPQQVAIEQAEGAAEFATTILESVNRMASLSSEEDFGGLGGGFFLLKRSAEPTESATYANGSWTYTYADAFTEGDFSFDADLTATLQFRNAQNVAQQFPDETTASMNYGLDADLGFSTNYTDPETQDTTTLTSDFLSSVDLSASGFLGNDLAVTGSGTQDVTLVGNTPEGNFNYSMLLDWDIDVLLPQNGDCPTGEVTFDFGPYTAMVTYDGTASAAWELREGASLVANGTEPIECSPPVGTAR